MITSDKELRKAWETANKLLARMDELYSQWLNEELSDEHYQIAMGKLVVETNEFQEKTCDL